MSKVTLIADGFDAQQRATLTISLTCTEWDRLGALLAGQKGEPFQSTADVICRGLAKVGYFVVKDATP
jgi:hypothetical protein